jgi:proteic killer suppression protein
VEGIDALDAGPGGGRLSKSRPEAARATGRAGRRRPRALVACCASGYNISVIKSFRHKGLKALFETGSVAEVQPAHAKRLRLQLAALDTARTVEDMNIPGWRLHPLKGGMAGRWSITVNGNWRMTFEFRDGDAHVLDYEDYH